MAITRVEFKPNIKFVYIYKQQQIVPRNFHSTLNK